MVEREIPGTIIGKLAKIFVDFYTGKEINSTFLAAGAPQDVNMSSSKETRVVDWLLEINRQYKEGEDIKPLEILGKILEGFMDRNTTGYDGIDPWEKDRNDIRETLANHQLSYVNGGRISDGAPVPTKSLQELVARKGLMGVNQEIERYLKDADNDPAAAIQGACAVLESSLKTYLEKHGIEYEKGREDLSSLWKKVIKHIGIKPSETDSNGLRKVASGSYTILDGIMYLRNKRSTAHGKSDEELEQYVVRPRDARLAVHASHTIACYVVDSMDKN